jgi:hypothetical protein
MIEIKSSIMRVAAIKVRLIGSFAGGSSDDSGEADSESMVNVAITSISPPAVTEDVNVLPDDMVGGSDN